jgi:signal peptidase II
MFWIVISLMVAAVDQITKYIIKSSIEYGQRIPVIDKFFYITYHENSGAAWGMMQGGRIVFIPITIVLVVIMLYYLRQSKNLIFKTALSIIIGGATGNLIDRIYPGKVPDFLDFHFGSYNFPTFNAADTFIVVGTILLSYYLLFIYKGNNLRDIGK